LGQNGEEKNLKEKQEDAWGKMIKKMEKNKAALQKKTFESK
jgi:hypothetical protein